MIKKFDYPTSENQWNMLELEMFLKKNFEMRYNTMLGVVEYRLTGNKKSEFEPLDKRALASITCDAMKKLPKTKAKDVKLLLNSDFVEQYNPLTDFLHNLPKWDGKERIEALANRIRCKEKEWPLFFHRWMLGMVAAWKGEDVMHGNCLVPILIGPQGYRKSTFWRNLLPPSMRYLFQENLNVKQKDNLQRSLHRFALISLDEFDQLTDKEQAHLKNVLQSPSNSYRQLYKEYICKNPRVASFCGTSNFFNLLKDPSGSRRYLCINVEDIIDTDTPMEYEQIYAQLLAELKKGERHWLTHEEEMLLEKSNDSYKEFSSFMETFETYFQKPENEEDGRFMKITEIVKILNGKSRVKINVNKVRSYSAELRQKGFEVKHTNLGTAFLVMPREMQMVA